MRSSTHASPDDIDITSIWLSIKSSMPKILVATLVAGALTYAVLALMAPRYSSEAQLEIAAKGSLPDPSRDPRRDSSIESVSVRMDKEAINTHVRALLSPDLARKIITGLKLDELPEFNSAKGSPDKLSAIIRFFGIGAPQKRESDLDRALATYFKQIDVYAPKESRSIVVRFTSIDPELASTVANRIAEVYRGELSSQIVVESDKAYRDLEPQIEALKQDVATAEADVERQRATADVFRSGGNSSSNTNEQQIAELTAEVSRAKSSRSEAEARARSAREMMRAGSADALPDVQKSPLMQALVQQRVRLQRTIAEVSASLLPGHPRMRQLNAELAGLNKQINGEVAKVVDSLEREAKIAALTVEAKTKSLNEMKSRVVTAAPDEVKLRNLEATAKSKRDELTSLQAKYESAKAIAASQAVPVEAKIVTEARASSVVVYPKKTSTALIAALAVFLFGTALSMTRALLRGAREPVGPRSIPMHPPRPVRSEPALVPLSVPLPAERVARERPGRATSIVTVADQLQSRAPGNGGFRSLIVGENAGIDAGPEALQLADEFARRGHATIVVDWSPDGAGFAQKVGLSRTPGFSELLGGTARFEDVVQRLPKSEAHVIASGAAQSYSTEGPDLNQLNLVLDALDDAYDHIIVIGAYDAARVLFEDVEGRFDAGITVCDGTRRVTVIQDAPGTFLGYEVADIELIRFERRDGAHPSTQRVSRPAQEAASDAHPA